MKGVLNFALRYPMDSSLREKISRGRDLLEGDEDRFLSHDEVVELHAAFQAAANVVPEEATL